jgi:hypothetical protein
MLEDTYLLTGDDARKDQLARIVESCLECEAAYKLFDMLSAISQLDMDAKLEYMEMVREAGVYTEEEVYALERLIVNGNARFFKDAIDQVRDEQVNREIGEMIGVAR